MKTAHRPQARPSKKSKPETLGQARNWERLKNVYLARGLCHRCASQAAYGHQLGFLSLEHEPCAACRPLVATFPRERMNGWRALANA
ncbi:hypothetical protein [Cellulosimicrobium sp. KWT-B]|jgi:hypothetical protein|uniref:hypothetical protein n=1 Tax=Cellulosimicrobium sp. KWT-B TaxID=1981152 RepID=UPI000A329194|nr:hypothetical protein [Cellulosimicrobium sp. KWT-B]